MKKIYSIFPDKFNKLNSASYQIILEYYPIQYYLIINCIKASGASGRVEDWLANVLEFEAVVLQF